ncbi:MAG: hypothetical protein COB76_03545 [Alphaproteobacteria bacterium]|nr:MAG: hypothetical protein COB76_03545 [Alphaproteobacteria bacterium]
MLFLNVIILSVVQGLTEFLPVSSSGHLVLFHAFLDEEIALDHVSKIVDIAVHVGTLFAVMLYFWKDLWAVTRGGVHLLSLNTKTVEAKKAALLIIASVPVIIAGFVLFQFHPTLFDALLVMAWMMLIFGVVLYIADRRPEGREVVEGFTIKQAFLYGMAQCLALVPGVSRSGITMTAGRFLGHSRTEAARFSLLMGMVAIAGAGTLAGASLWGGAALTHEFLSVLAVGVGCSFIMAYGAIFLMMRWVERASFTPFVIYRVVLGVVLLGLLYGGIIPQDM